MATTRTPELPLDPSPAGGPPQWITAIANWCDTYSQTHADSDSEDVAYGLSRLGEDVVRTFRDAQGREPTDPEYFEWYAASLDQYGFRWDATTHTVQPNQASRPVEDRPHGEPGDSTDPSAAWFLSTAELAATRAKIETLNTRAAKKGFTGRIALTATAATRTHTPGPGAPAVTVHGFEVSITGQPPAYDGWTFLAAVDKLDQPPGSPSAAILRYPPGAAQNIDPTTIQPGACDHCHTVRTRTTTFLVRHDQTGQTRQVGRTCLKDFLGWSTTPVFIDTDHVRDEIERGLGARTPPLWDLESVLTYTWAVIAAHGWTPSSAAGPRRDSTRNLVAQAIRGGRGAETLLASLAPHLPEGAQLAPRISADLAPRLTATTGYEANLAALLRSGTVDPDKHLGLAVSAVNAWHRLNETHLASPAEPRPTISHAGTVGEKITLTGTVITKMGIDGYHRYSPTQVLLVIDCGTAVAKTITTAAWAYDLQRGQTLTLTGTVKAHDTYRGVAQTVISRPKKHDLPTPNPALAADTPVWETVTANPTRSRSPQDPPPAAPSPSLTI